MSRRLKPDLKTVLDRYNDIIHRMKSAGLIDLWQRQDLDRRVKGILETNVELFKRLTQKSVYEIEFPMFIVYGWAAGSVLFVLEIISKQF